MTLNEKSIKWFKVSKHIFKVKVDLILTNYFLLGLIIENLWSTEFFGQIYTYTVI